MSSQPTSIARRKFARRLRELRVVRGYRTARSFARALGIDENRYTRYERAEVEPDITLIQRICETLRLSPNDLLGMGTTARDRLSVPARPLGAAGFAEPQQAPMQPPAGGADPRDQAAWSLACAVAELESKIGAECADQTRLGTLRRAAKLFADLERRPYAAVSEILLLPVVAEATGEDAQRLGKLIEVVTHVAA